MWQSQDPRWPLGSEREELLTPMEFFELYAGLPTEAELKAGPSSVLTRLATWEATHGAVARRQPARTMLANLRRALSRSGPAPR